MVGSQAKRRTLVLAVAAVAALTVVPSALAAPTWLAPQRVGPITEPSCLFFSYDCDTEIAVAPDGTAYLATAHYDDTATNKRRVSVSVRPPGGSFGSRQFLSPAGMDSTGVNGEPVDIAVDRNGNVTVAWAYFDTVQNHKVVQAAYRPAGASSFRASETLSNTSHDADMPSVAVSDGGGGVVVWRNINGAQVTVQRAFRNPGALSFGSLSDISAVATSITSPKVVMAPSGNAAAIWSQDSSIVTIPRPAGQAFDVVQRTTLASGGGSVLADSPDLAIARNGRVTAIWRRDANTGAGGDEVIESRERTATPSFAAGLWSSTDTVTEPTETGGSPSVAVDGDNTAVAVWSGLIGGQTRVRAAARDSGGSFTDHDPISGPQASSFAPQVNMSPQGVAVATWSLGMGGIELVQSARRPPGGSFGGVDNVMTGTSSPFKGVWFQPGPTVGFDSQGNAFATWIGYTCCGGDPTRNFIEVAGFDAAPPTIGSASVPSVGTTGQAVGMSASVTDRLSAATVTWNFGDGGTATGGSVSHAYGAPGVYNVTIRARDAVGNEATTVRAIQISNPSTGGGGGGGGGGGIDADGDGFLAGQDCNDGNAAIRPGAQEVRGNNIDENCDGVAAPFQSIVVTLARDFAAFSTYTILQTLSVKGVPRGSRVQAVCRFKGKKCNGKARKKFSKKRARGTVNLKPFTRVRLKAGTTITVTVSRSSRIGAVKILKIRGGKKPKTTDRCLPPGARRPQRRC